ncbi:kinase-like domain-containing protein [Coemansia mojavensis]|nr:kinase-like domain-containing protein [Coemansia mojavensis]
MTEGRILREELESFAQTKGAYVPTEIISHDLVKYFQENDSHIPTKIIVSYHMNKYSCYEIDNVEMTGFKRIVMDELKDLILHLHGIYDRNVPRKAWLFRELLLATDVSNIILPIHVESGRYADIWKTTTRIKNSRGPWALKRFKEVNNYQQDYIMNEAEVMQKLEKYELAPKFIEYHWVDQRLKGLYMEWFERGSLREAISGASKSQRSIWSKELRDKIKILHNQNIVHGDISPENILVADDNTLRFCDFHSSGEGRNCIGKSIWYKDIESNTREGDIKAVNLIANILSSPDISF